MRSKLIIVLTILFCITCVALAFYAKAWDKWDNLDTAHYYIEMPLVLASSATQLENELRHCKGYLIKHEVSASHARYIFYEITPYYGFMIKVLYCYEWVKDDSLQKKHLLLRGYFPINYEPYINVLARDNPQWKPGEDDSITYVPAGDSVNVKILGDDLFCVKSMWSSPGTNAAVQARVRP